MLRSCTTPHHALDEGATYHRVLLNIRGRRLGGLRGLTRLGRGSAPHDSGDYPRLAAVRDFRLDALDAHSAHRRKKISICTLVRPVPLCLSCDVLARVAGRAAHTRRSAATPHGSCCHPLLALRAAGVAPTRAAPARAGPGAGDAAPACRSTAGASDTKREHQQRRTRSGGGAPRPRRRRAVPILLSPAAASVVV